MTASLFSGRRSSERSLCLHQLMIRDPVRFNTEISSQAGSILPTQSRRDSVQFDWQQTAGLYAHCFKYGVVVQPEVLFWYLLLWLLFNFHGLKPDFPILTSDLRPQQGISLHTIAARWIFFFLFRREPQRWLSQCENPSRSAVCESPAGCLVYQQPRPPPSQSLHSPFILHSGALFELQPVVCAELLPCDWLMSCLFLISKCTHYLLKWHLSVLTSALTHNISVQRKLNMTQSSL